MLHFIVNTNTKYVETMIRTGLNIKAFLHDLKNTRDATFQSKKTNKY